MTMKITALILKTKDTKYNCTQYNDTQHNDTQQSDTQHSDIQHNTRIFYTQHNIALSVSI